MRHGRTGAVSEKELENKGFHTVIEDLNDKVDIIYRHGLLLENYSGRVRDYGNGYQMSEVEAHTLSYICANGEATVTGMAAYTFRTKGSVSKILKKLESKGLIQRQQKGDNKKWVYFQPTEQGLEFDKAHRSYDRIKTMEMIEALLADCTLEEIESFYKVTALRVRFLEKKHMEADGTFA